MARAEIEALARHLRLTTAEFGKRYLRRVGPRYSLIEKPGGECVFYDRGCTVYPVRPLQCRSFPFWGDNLKSRRAWEEAARECPGMGEGRLYTTAEIVRIRRGEVDATAG
jgi:Fe-S-cluster containining protein